MQLQDVLDAPQLRIRAVYTTPEALARPVNWTFTTDLLDPRRYLARDQLVLTGLVWRRTPEDSETFVSAVAASGAVALLAGEGLYGFVPDDVIAACRAHGVALFAVPADVSFASITTHLSNTLAGDRVARLTAGLARQRELLTEVYRGQLLDELITRTSTELGRPVRVLTSTGRVAASAEPIGLTEIERVVRAGLSARRNPVTVPDAHGGVLSVFVVAGAGEHRATSWFVVVAGDWNEWHPSLLDAVTELTGVVGLYRLQRDSAMLADSALADRLLELIEEDSEQPETAVYLRQLGLAGGGRCAVVAAGFEEEPPPISRAGCSPTRPRTSAAPSSARTPRAARSRSCRSRARPRSRSERIRSPWSPRPCAGRESDSTDRCCAWGRALRRGCRHSVARSARPATGCCCRAPPATPRRCGSATRARSPRPCSC
ncbi:PucR family transcriptional regulator ligand-binding domain-containing protein [Rathayibacter oskolensis]|uniref:PucR family transcriptional regulator ligand-binding domain-containing protein n=1 Tax=Rathayibacter oskolensis TaxID=1891671 RepID=UPI00265F1EBA|nr:PucR family transcriptional regulator ligand-binding domain-containing protein [Rathayibacter oskolensis]WKK71526.1 PucR family transcriptional regulator ligand-binding domain-containing protein [Rathayibacter oskolensis]